MNFTLPLNGIVLQAFSLKFALQRYTFTQNASVWYVYFNVEKNIEFDGGLNSNKTQWHWRRNDDDNNNKTKKHSV